MCNAARGDGRAARVQGSPLRYAFEPATREIGRRKIDRVMDRAFSPKRTDRLLPGASPHKR